MVTPGFNRPTGSAALSAGEVVLLRLLFTGEVSVESLVAVASWPLVLLRLQASHETRFV
jgi:hypothetical protein